MGVMAELLHLHPWDIDRLTVRDFEIYETYLERREKGARGG
jgi:hypothetical protein